MKDLQTYVEQHTRLLPYDGEGAVDVGFFGVVKHEEPNSQVLAKLILDNETGEFARIDRETWKGGPHYITIGGWIGDQQLALRLIGLGDLLGLWQVGLPSTLGITRENDPDAFQKLLGQGFVYAIPSGGFEWLKN